MPTDAPEHPAPIPLRSNEVSVFTMDPSESLSEHDLAILCAQEKTRADGLRTEARRREYVCARVLQRRALSLHAEVDPAEWRFAAGAGGRPEIIAPSRATALRFNLSHTAGLVACAVAWGLSVGIDVEHLGSVEDIDVTAHHVFAPAEAAEVRALPEAERASRLLEIWTLKEACLKAIGTGFAAVSPHAVRFSLAPDRTVSGSVDADLGRACALWHFVSRRLPTGHVLGLAVPTPDPSRCTVVWRRYPA